MMKKRILSILLCLFMALSLLPMTALAAADYDGWEAATAEGVTLNEGDTVTIGGVAYTYKGDGGSGINMKSGDFALTDTCCWKAGSGYVLYKPTVEKAPSYSPYDGVFTGDVATSAEVTLHGAAISASGGTALVLPSNNGSGDVYPVPVTVRVEGINSLTTDGKTNYALLHEGSDTAFTGGGTLTLTNSAADAWYNLLNTDGAVTVDSGTQVTVNGGDSNGVGGNLTVTGSGSKLTIAGGTSLGIGVFGGIPTATVTVKDGGVLENNGTLWMGEKVDKDNSHIVGEISGSGGIKLDNKTYTLVDGVFYPYGGDISTSGLDLSSSAPTEMTRYKAGSGYISYTPATTDPVANAKLELHGAQISTTSNTALTLPADAPVDIVVASDSSLTAGGSGDVIEINGQPLSITGSGNLALASPRYGINGTGVVSISINITGNLTFDTVYQPITADGDITVSAKSITSNSGYYFQSSGAASLTATDGDIVFDEAGKTEKSNKIYANQDITLNAPKGKIDIAHSDASAALVTAGSGVITVSALNDVIINAVSGGSIDAAGAVSVTSQSGSIDINCGDSYDCISACDAVGAITLSAAKNITLSGSGTGANAIRASGRAVDITAGGKLSSTSGYGFQVNALTIQANDVSIEGTTQYGIEAGSVSITNSTGGNCKSVSVTATSGSSEAIYCIDVTVKSDDVFLSSNGNTYTVSASGTVTIGDAGLIVGAIDAGTKNIASGITCASVSGGDKSGGLNLSTAPTEATYYKAGSGYALFIPATAATPATLTLHNATIYNTTAINDETGVGIALPDGAVTIVLEAINTAGAQYTNAISGSDTDVTLSGTGVLNVGDCGIALKSTAANPHSLTKGAGVILNGIVHTYDNSDESCAADINTVYGSVTFSSGTKIFTGAFTVTAGAVLTIPQGTTLDLDSTTSISNSGTIVNNGTMTLPQSFNTEAAVKALKLTGSGVVKVDGNYYTNAGVAVAMISGGLDLSTGDHSGATLADDGYTFSNNTLALGNVYIENGLTMPCNTAVTINTTASSSISGGITAATNAGGYHYPLQLTFTGTAPLTISGGIGGGVNDDTVTVQSGAQVTINGAVSIGASGTDGTLNVIGSGTMLDITSDGAYGAMCDAVNVQSGAALTVHTEGAGTMGVEALGGGVHVSGGSTLTAGCEYGVYIIGGKLEVDSTSKLITNGAIAPFCIVGAVDSTQDDVLSLAADLPSGTAIASRQATNGSGTTHTYWSLVPTGGNLTVSNTDNTPVTLTGAVTGTLTFSKAASTPTGGGGGSTSYTLTFEANGGSAVDTLSKASGTAVDLNGYKPTRDGYAFAGWYSDAALTTKVTSITLIKNTTVYAKWTAKSANPFADVPDNAYYHDAVLWAAEKNITGGTSNTTFSPNMTCTRAQMAVFLWRAEGSPEPTSSSCPFSDMAQNAYYYKAVLWAVEQGITAGTSTTTFGPDNTITRGQAATFLWRAAGKPSASSSNPFADVSPDAYYYTAVLWVAEKRISNGTSATTFSPSNSCTRAQIVTFLYRYAGE